MGSDVTNSGPVDGQDDCLESQLETALQAGDAADAQPTAEPVESEPAKEPATPVQPEAKVPLTDGELLAEIEAAAKVARERERELQAAESGLKVAKEHVKACEGNLHAALRKVCQLSLHEDMPLFSQHANGTGECAASATLDGETVPMQSANDSWRSVRLDSLDDPDFTPSLLKKLAAAEIETIGQLVDYQATGKWITSIHGIGQAAGDKLADAMERFWAAHPEYAR
ncbi:MAG: hypothetical protein A3E01_02600 [Gammaproteobacteria bacterium RIFCSPHIGHO2_12_FULL_63_22]|nr:MAG: hypothetical protein A3E01_02600 [Gammaproteobacteria bacterium RIFCSPHIGHO2_12_FULL_63_22]